MSAPAVGGRPPLPRPGSAAPGAATPVPGSPSPGRQSAAAKTPEQLATVARQRAREGGLRLIGRLYSTTQQQSSPSPASQQQQDASSPQGSPGRRTDDSGRARRLGVEEPASRTQTTSLSLLRDQYAKGGKVLTDSLSQPRKIRRSELRDTLQRPIDVVRPTSSSHSPRRAPRPSSAITTLSAMPRTPASPRSPAVRELLPPVESHHDPEEDEAEHSTDSPFAFIRRAERGDVAGQFIYLVMRPRGVKDPYNPYDLVVVPHNKTDSSNYFTMAREGVTHVRNGEADFLTLDGWLREHQVFGAALRIPFFRKYRRWKAFHFWKKYVRRTKVSEYKEHLEDNLFLLNPSLSPSLLRIRSICQDLTVLHMYSPFTETRNLDQYMDMQTRSRDATARELDRRVREVRDIIDAACKACMTAAAPRAVIEDARDAFEAPTRLGHGRVLPTPHDTQPERQSYIELSQRRAACRRLTSFIRLCDYMMIDALVRLTFKSVAEVRSSVLFPKPITEVLQEHAEEDDAERMEKTAKELALEAAGVNPGASRKSHIRTGPFNGPVYFVEIVFVDDGIVIQPSLDSFLHKVESVVRGFTETIVRVERFVAMEAFAKYTQHVAADQIGDTEVGMGPDVSDMVTSEDSYKTLIRSIRTSLQTAFGKVEDYAVEFEVFKLMYLENRKLDPHQIKEEDPPLDWFRDERLKYRKQQEEIERLATQKDVAIFVAKTDKFKQTLQPSPLQCLDRIETLLPVIAKEKNDALFEEAADANGKLEHESETVEEFVDYIKFHMYISDRLEEINREYDVVNEMYLLIMTELDQRAPQVHDEHMRFCEGTGPHVVKLRQLVSSAEDSKDSQVRHFSDVVDKQHVELRHRMLDVFERSKHPMVEDEDRDEEEVIDYVGKLMKEMEQVKSRERELTSFQELFDPTRLAEVGGGMEEELLEVYRKVGDKERLWCAKRDWRVVKEQWSETVFAELDAAELEAEVQRYEKIIKQVKRTQRSTVVTKLESDVEEFKLIVPIAQHLKNPHLKEHHLQQIDQYLKQDLSKDKKFTLGTLIELHADDLVAEIKQISNQATQEQQLEEMLQVVARKWQGIEFSVTQYKEQKDTYVIGSVEEILTHLEDSTIAVSTINSNRFCTGHLKKRTQQWEDDMKYMMDCLDKWLEFQRKWMYLESIFSHKELQQQWPDDAKIFLTLDRSFRELMKKAHASPTVRTTLTQNNYKLLPQFRTDIDTFERIEKRLEDKLDKKRRIFPRFYFLSNDDLLDILANIRRPEKVAPHMLKMFDNIKKCELTEQHDVTKMVSAEGEKVPMVRQVKARGPVEKWLGEVEAAMIGTVRKNSRYCWEDRDQRPRMKWIFEHSCQCVLVCSQIFWTRDGHDAIESGQLKQFADKNQSDLRELAAATAQSLDKVGRCMIRTLITLDVHNRDLAAEMLKDKIQTVDQFGWTKLLRFYFEVMDGSDGQGDVIVRQNNSSFVFGYEYLGAQGRLVITPLTDRVFMTITGALHLCLGTAPSGPAGTGKTESSKDLAKGLGRQCIVYNCSEGVTYKMMETFFAGLCQTGAWTCLDEFNRISIEVLSVVASQLTEVRSALQAQRQDPSLKAFTFQGVPDIGLKPSFGCIITMNPGYAGRTELPDNLKALFRPISVMTPDFRMIAEVILYSEGFGNAHNLSLKITQLYKLSSEQLSAQHHYDFGMRALKSILVMAGDLKRSQPDVHEDLTLIVACNDSNIPKFVAGDIPLFKGIMNDLFPGVQIPARTYEELDAALAREMQPKQLKMVPSFITKIYQLYETLIVRHGVMTVGATGGGKSVCRNSLAVALSDMKERGSTNPQAQLVHQHILNPKSISMHELYGNIDVNTQEWQDGILPMVVKSCRQINDAGEDGFSDHQWIVFDGPVDTLWVESMNSVLDDSKLLCLDNGVRIRLPDTIHMMFEVADLAVASPATVSRCGMVYMDFVELGWQPTVYTWVRKKMVDRLGPAGRAYLEELFETKLTAGLKWLYTQASQLIPAVEANIVASCCELFHGLCVVHDVKFPPDATSEEEKDDATARERRELINVMFSFCFIWSVGGNIDDKSRDVFDTWVRDTGGPLEDIATFSGPYSVYDFTVDFSSRNFVAWETMVAEFQYDAKVPFFDIVVPTVDTVRFSYLLRLNLRVRRPIMFSGASGTGKSILIQQTLREEKNRLDLVNVTIQFSAKTSSARTQDMIESKLKAKRKNLLGAPTIEGTQRTVALFIDDLNMPALEQFGASPPVELLRQMIGSGGFYDKKYLFWKTVQDVTCLAACGPPEGGRSPVTPRLLRFFHMLQIPNLSEEAMQKIFKSILNGFFSSAPFSADSKDTIKGMVDGAVEVYNTIRDKLRPRPSKPHYTFNLRDLSKVFQGITQVVPKTCSTAMAACKLWIHEVQRCFYDRLVDDTDRLFFSEEVMMPAIQRCFPCASKFTHSDLFSKPLIWGDYLRPAAPQEEWLYESCNDLDKLPRIFKDDYLLEHNLRTGKMMNLVFFNDHCYHLSRIIRIIRQPRGNALLVGVGGSGKQSLTRLASGICGCQCFQIEVNSRYTLDKFHEDLLDLYQIAGIDQKQVVFLFTDTQIVDEGMVEDINNMLNSGEVPSLFTPEEKDKKINQSMEKARENNMAGSRDEVYSYFISRVRDNLHIVLGMSPVGDAFRTRCRNFPSLTNCCTIDWFDKWPDDALLQVAQDQFTGDTAFDFKQFDSDVDLVGALTEMCVEIHSSVSDLAEQFFEELRRRYYVTPTSYLEFIRLYITLLEDKHKEMNDQLHKLAVGSDKMIETNEFIERKQAEITAQKPILEEAAVKNKALMEEVTIRQEKASRVRVSVTKQEEEASEQQRVAHGLKEEAEKDLGEALPDLMKAEKALQSLDKAAINEIKSYKQPPEAVEMTLEAVMILLQEGKYDWKRAKDLLGRPNFMQLLLEFDRDRIPKQVITKVSRFIKDDKFHPDEIERGGSAATKVLCIWCHATCKYYEVSVVVEPKREALRSAEADLAVTTAKLKEAQAALKAVEDELAELQSRFDNSKKEKARLEENIETSKRQLVNAEHLTESLGSEAERWSLQKGELRAALQLIPGDVFLASASICYFGAFTPTFRKHIVSHWLEGVRTRKLPHSEGYSLVRTCADPMRVQEWQIYSLPTDETSSENAVLCNVSCEGEKLRRWPLMIDPQGQATKWIKSEQASRGLKVVKMTQPRYLNVIEQAITNGLPVLIDDVGEQLDPALEPVLQKQVYQDGGRFMINLGGENPAIEYSRDFRLYMTTKMANPHYLPEVCIKVTLINFTVTSEGLEDQMLGDVVSIERAELEEEKSEVIRSVAHARKNKKKLENQILEKLESASGNILDDTDLIRTLQSSSTNSVLLVKQLKAAEEKEKGINEAREVFRPVANRAAILYFVIASLPLVAPMYQYSLDYFKRIVKTVIQVAPKHDTMEEHLGFLRGSVTETAYTAVCRGLFNADKVVYSIMLCSAIMRGQKMVSDEEWSYFNRASALVRSELPAKPEALDWMPDASWGLLDAVDRKVPELSGLLADVVQFPEKWEDWFSLHEPQDEPLPGGGEGVDWAERCTNFQKCIIVRVFREEKLLYQLMNLCRDELGPRFIEPPPFDMEVALKDSAFDRPVIFILSQGSDPTDSFFKWAKEKNKTVRTVSMGQGQEGPAKRMIEAGRKAGDWVLLQNCHLGKTFMNGELQEIIANLDPNEKQSKADFRFWMTSMPVNYFPTLILQNSIKLTNEAPSGMKANMRRCYGGLKEIDVACFDDVGKWQDFADGTARSHAYKKLLWGLHFFHAVILERRKFGPLGWNNRYEWNDTDLDVSRQWLKLFLEQEEVPWESMVYIIGQINYGGRVTDPLDRLCMMSVLKTYFSDPILDDAYVFSQSGIYHAPAEGDHRHYMTKIEQLPQLDEPEVFGMHENASLRFQLQESQLMMQTLLTIQPRTTSKKGGQSPEEQAREKASEMQAVLPEKMNIEEAGPKSITFMENGVPNSLSTVLTHEIDKFNRLISQQGRTLTSLKKALAGETLLSDDLDQMFTDFLNDRVPALWSKAAYLSMKPLGSWMRDMVQRVHHCRQWLKKGQPPSFWMSGLFSPHGFMTGVLQAHARQFVISVDVLGFGFSILDAEPEDISECPHSGVYCHGLISDSWRWDRELSVMADSLAGRLYDELPVIHFLPEEHHECPPHKYACPCYITTSRKGTLSSLGASTNFILCVEATTDKEGGSDYWIRKGAAMVCQLPT